METDLDKTPEIHLTEPPVDYTLPVVAAHDFKVRWSDKAIQFETPNGMRHLAWKDVVLVSVSEEKPGLQLLMRTVDLTDRGGVVHKIAIADIPDKAPLDRSDRHSSILL